MFQPIKRVEHVADAGCLRGGEPEGRVLPGGGEQDAGEVAASGAGLVERSQGAGLLVQQLRVLLNVAYAIVSQRRPDRALGSIPSVVKSRLMTSRTSSISWPNVAPAFGARPAVTSATIRSRAASASSGVPAYS
jgi:hypothetical protein